MMLAAGGDCMPSLRTRVLFFGKANDYHTDRALAHLRRFFDVRAFVGDWGDPFPPEAHLWSGDYIVSFLGRWIVPASVLGMARVAAINFHPGPPEYPGIGCVNFALYEGANCYGATCHQMVPEVDSGGIYMADRFLVMPEDDVASVLGRTYDTMLMHLYLMTLCMRRNGDIRPNEREQWSGTLHTRAELDALAVITPDMDEAEIARRTRAVTYGPWTVRR